MKPLYTDFQFENSRSRDSLPFECEKCHKTFYGIKNEIQKYLSRIKRGVKSSRSFKFCSKACLVNGKEYSCKHCGKLIYRTPSRTKNNNIFCSKKCSSIYNQKNGGYCHWSDKDKERLRIQAKNNPKFIGWNKGKRYASTIILKCRVCNSEFVQTLSKRYSNKTQTCSKECRYIIQSSIIKKQYENGKRVCGGTTKWISYRNIRVQGSYEYRTCIVLDKWKDLGRIKTWEYTTDRIPYIGSDGKVHNYLIDFKVWNKDGSFYYLETKGYIRDNDNLKWKTVRDKGHRLKVWFDDDIKREENNLME